MKRSLLVLFLAFPSIGWGHPLPPGYCDTGTVVTHCVESCKEGLTGNLSVKKEAFKKCLNECLFSTTCESITVTTAETGSLLSLNSASDTPQIEGIWVGDIEISSGLGQVIREFVLSVSKNDFGRLEAVIEIDQSDSDDVKFTRLTYATLSEQNPILWSVAFAGDSGMVGQGSFDNSVPPFERSFTLEVNCVVTSEPAGAAFSCPFSGKAVLIKEP